MTLQGCGLHAKGAPDSKPTPAPRPGAKSTPAPTPAPRPAAKSTPAPAPSPSASLFCSAAKQCSEPSKGMCDPTDSKACSGDAEFPICDPLVKLCVKSWADCTPSTA